MTSIPQQGPPSKDAGFDAAPKQDLASKILLAWNADYFAKRWIVWALGLAFVVYLAGLAILGPVPSTTAANDTFLLLDGGWRILHLVPFRDFTLSLGPLTYMSVAA